MSLLRAIWANRNYRIASIISALTLLWLGSGMVMPEEKKTAQKIDVGDTATLTQVRARYVEAQPFPMVIHAAGNTGANRAVDVKAEVSGQVAALPVAEGARVQAGDVICRLAQEDRELRVTEAKAMLAQAQIEYDGALKLKSGGYQSESAIAAAKARLDAAKAELRRRELDLAKTEIRAPFAGVVDVRPAEIGALLRPGESCATVLDLDPLLVTAHLSEQEVIRVPPDAKVKARLINGELLHGNLRYIARNAETTTRTYRVEAAIANPEFAHFGGITTELQIYAGSVPAHVIPASVLMLDDAGALGVRIVDAQDKVRFYRVEMLGDDDHGVWVNGLPERALLITVGQEYVAEGETVAVVMDDAAGSGEDRSDAAVDTGKAPGTSSF